MTLPRTVDLNADLGEGFPNDARLLELVTSASICCGAHAGGPDLILATLSEAARRGVVVGAHPGFADREGFGRREQAITTRGARLLILEQTERLRELAKPSKVVVRFLKPHGALYNQAQRDPAVAEGVVSAALALGLPVLGQPLGELERAAQAAHLRFVPEGFPDRRYEPDGRLVPRSRPDAVLDDPDEIAEQVGRLVAAGLATLCVHGDDPNAVRNAEALRKILDRRGISPKFWG